MEKGRSRCFRGCPFTLAVHGFLMCFFFKLCLLLGRGQWYHVFVGGLGVLFCLCVEFPSSASEEPKTHRFFLPLVSQFLDTESSRQKRSLMMMLKICWIFQVFLA